MCEEIIAHKGVYSEGSLNAALINMFDGPEGETIQQFRQRIGDRDIIRNLFSIEIDTEKWEDSSLYVKYNEILSTGQENELFRKLHKISKNFAVSIEAHTYLYHITRLEIDDLSNEKLFPWYTICSVHDIADTWWETDDEILTDMSSMSFIEYVEKYRMFRE